MPRSLINKIMDKVSGSKTSISALQSVRFQPEQIPHRRISKNALKVIERLQAKGYQGYLVGGGVRDLLLNMRPKDFDVATNATPEQVKACFGNARIIGRRFRLVHVRFGREIIEVATFRGNQDDSNKISMSKEGMLTRDNHWGSLDDDAVRRDFTVNALYYDSQSQQLLALPGGMEDLQTKVLRIIGDPSTRYREDPVRMLRAARFAVKLDFELDQQTRAPIPDLANLLQKIPAARLFDEVIKLLMSGRGLDTFRQCNELGLMAPMFPDSWQAMAQDDSGRLMATIEQGLMSTDQRIQAERPVTPAFLYALLLWPAVLHFWRYYHQRGKPGSTALNQAINHVLARHASFVAIPKRFSIPMREIWELQPRLTRTGKQRNLAVLNHGRYRAAYDFLLMRERSGEESSNYSKWWDQAWQEKQSSQFATNEPDPSANSGYRSQRARRPSNHGR